MKAGMGGAPRLNHGMLVRPVVLLCYETSAVSGGRPHQRQGSRCSSARASSSYAVAMEVGTWRSGRTGSAPRLETSGKRSGSEEGQRLRGGKTRPLGGEEGIRRDT